MLKNDIAENDKAISVNPAWWQGLFLSTSFSTPPSGASYVRRVHSYSNKGTQPPTHDGQWPVSCPVQIRNGGKHNELRGEVKTPTTSDRAIFSTSVVESQSGIGVVQQAITMPNLARHQITTGTFSR